MLNVLQSYFKRKLTKHSTRVTCLFMFGVILISACKKDKAKDPVPETPVAVTSDTSLKCVNLPSPPQPFGWKDSTASQDKNINAFFYNPLNSNEVIYVANGDVFGYNKMYVYNIPAKQIKYLSDNGSDLPRVNTKGWIVFGRADLNIYKIKVNGDSLVQLTSNNLCRDAKWDNQGNHIFFYQAASGALANVLVETDKNGAVINTTPTELPNTAFAHKTNRVAFIKTSNTTISLYFRDLATGSETLILSAQGGTESFQTQFSNLTFDNADESLYWSNSGGIFKCNLAAPAIETVLKNCSNIKYDRPLITPNSSEITLACHYMRQLSYTQLLHQYKAFEFDLNLKQLHELKVFL